MQHHEEEEVVLTLDECDYLELAYSYLNYKNGGYKRCEVCGRWFKSKSNAAKYCSIHRPDYEQSRDVEIECIECGKRFLASPLATETCRCEQCNSVYQRQRNAIKNKAYRNRIKNKS